MEEYKNHEAYELSMGQKQRITIAGVLSIKPKYIVMDEPTAMLDPEGKEEIKKIVKELKNQGYTIIYITNVTGEIFLSDRVIFLENGKIAKEFETKNLLNNIDFLKEKGIIIPKTIDILEKLKKENINLEFEDLI